MMLLYDTTSLNGDGLGVAVAVATDEAATFGVGEGATALPPHAVASTRAAIERARARRIRHLPHTRNVGRNGNTIQPMTEPGVETPFLVDPYLAWVRREGVPIYQDFGFDLRRLELRP